jgi:hypothetical protein
MASPNQVQNVPHDDDVQRAISAISQDRIQSHRGAALQCLCVRWEDHFDDYEEYGNDDDEDYYGYEDDNDFEDFTRMPWQGPPS